MSEEKDKLIVAMTTVVVITGFLLGILGIYATSVLTKVSDRVITHFDEQTNKISNEMLKKEDLAELIQKEAPWVNERNDWESWRKLTNSRLEVISNKLDNLIEEKKLCQISNSTGTSLRQSKQSRKL